MIDQYPEMPSAKWDKPAPEPQEATDSQIEQWKVECAGYGREPKLIARITALKGEVERLKSDADDNQIEMVVLQEYRDALKAELATAEAVSVKERGNWIERVAQERGRGDRHERMHATAIGECQKINKAIHRVLRGRNNAIKERDATSAKLATEEARRNEQYLNAEHFRAERDAALEQKFCEFCGRLESPREIKRRKESGR
jgi:FtsZ-binding cell division protein ZapB